VRLERLDEAKAVGARVLTLQPTFSSGSFCTALGLPPALFDALVTAWREIGLPK